MGERSVSRFIPRLTSPFALFDLDCERETESSKRVPRNEKLSKAILEFHYAKSRNGRRSGQSRRRVRLARGSRGGTRRVACAMQIVLATQIQFPRSILENILSSKCKRPLSLFILLSPGSPSPDFLNLGLIPFPLGTSRARDPDSSSEETNDIKS